jgi:hypothetical protein
MDPAIHDLRRGCISADSEWTATVAPNNAARNAKRTDIVGMIIPPARVQYALQYLTRVRVPSRRGYRCPDLRR